MRFLGPLSISLVVLLGCADDRDSVDQGGAGGAGAAANGGAGAAGVGGQAGQGGHDGTATVNGAVGDDSLDPSSVIAGESSGFVFVFTHVETLHHAVAVSDFDDACGNTDIEGTSFYLDLFQNPSLADSTVTSPGTFPIWLPALNGEPTPTDNRAVLTFIVNGPDGGRSETAQSGTVTVTSVDDSHIAADFDVTFEDGSLAGSFDAPICSPWTRSGSVP